MKNYKTKGGFWIIKDHIEEAYKEILKDKQNIIELLKEILEIPIKNIELIGVEHFESIIEYKFSLLKINLICENNERKEIYLKMIKGGKIKESVFCFWSLLYEEYLKNNKNEGINTIQQKTIITQRSSKNDNSQIVLTLNQNLDYCVEINLVEIENFAIKNNNVERWVEELDIKSEDILFIGIKKVLKNK